MTTPIQAATAARASMIASCIHFCKKTTIHMDNPIHVIVKAQIISCMRFIDKKELFTRIIGSETFIDWEYIDAVQGSDGRNLLGDSNTWLSLMEFVSFDNLKIPEMTLKSNYQPLWCIYDSLKQCRVLDMTQSAARDNKNEKDAAGGDVPYSLTLVSQLDEPVANRKLTFEDVCKICILNNIQGLLSKNIIDLYISAKLRRNAHMITSTLLSSLADQRHNEDVYLSSMQYLLGMMKVYETEFKLHVEHYNHINKSRQAVWKMKHIQSVKCRPSLRAIAAREGNVDASTSGIFSSRDSMGDNESVASSSIYSIQPSQHNPSACGASFMGIDHYCDSVIRFPNNLSRLTRLRCYLLASMGHAFDYSRHTNKLVSGTEVIKSINANPIVFPDPNAISVAIETLFLNIAPFTALDNFRQICFSSMAINHRRTLTLTQALQLYIAAYQRKEIWKICWKHIFPVMSTQISKDVEAFVASTPFAIEEFISILKYSTCA